MSGLSGLSTTGSGNADVFDPHRIREGLDFASGGSVMRGDLPASCRWNGQALLQLSCELRSPDGILLASVQENIFEADPTQLHDLILDTAPTHVKLWFSKRNIGRESVVGFSTNIRQPTRPVRCRSFPACSAN